MASQDKKRDPGLDAGRGSVTSGTAPAGNDRHGSGSKERRREFERLAMPALDMLYRQAMKYTNNPEDAEDLVQDTFERGYKAFDSFTKGTNIEAWLTVILRNTYFNNYQKKKRRPRRANDATGEYNDWDLYDLSNHTGTGLRSAEQEYLSDSIPPEIIDALNALPPERRRVFISTAIDGKSYKQVAQEEGIKIGTVMSRLNRARRQLRAALADLAPTSSDPDGAHPAGRAADRTDARTVDHTVSIVHRSRISAHAGADTAVGGNTSRQTAVGRGRRGGGAATGPAGSARQTRED